MYILFLLFVCNDSSKVVNISCDMLGNDDKNYDNQQNYQISRRVARATITPLHRITRDLCTFNAVFYNWFMKISVDLLLTLRAINLLQAIDQSINPIKVA